MAETVRRISVMLRNCQCLHWKEMTHQQSFIEQFTDVDVYKSDLIAYLTHFYTDLTHFHLHSHSYQSYVVEVSAIVSLHHNIYDCSIVSDPLVTTLLLWPLTD